MTEALAGELCTLLDIIEAEGELVKIWVRLVFLKIRTWCFSNRELVTYLGGHSVGVSHCSFVVLDLLQSDFALIVVVCEGITLQDFNINTNCMFCCVWARWGVWCRWQCLICLMLKTVFSLNYSKNIYWYASVNSVVGIYSMCTWWVLSKDLCIFFFLCSLCMHHVGVLCRVNAASLHLDQ